jgi:hypothetical protein
MTKREKLLAKLERNPRGVALRDFEALIRAFGYIEEGGKHPKAIIGPYTRPYKRESPVKSYYVKELLEIIKSLV